ncbi:hypothetical protein KCP73_18665 [Salmonella enterica subsp. enterica]|nr:hypothetical protein KCP73_18665 [Salmonella enterica subsp. enterica]
MRVCGGVMGRVYDHTLFLHHYGVPCVANATGRERGKTFASLRSRAASGDYFTQYLRDD